MEFFVWIGTIVHQLPLFSKVFIVLYLAWWMLHPNQTSHDYVLGVAFWIMVIFMVLSILRHGQDTGTISGCLVAFGFAIVLVKVVSRHH
jgi:cell division protein FtsW (lipid II flippase)